MQQLASAQIVPALWPDIAISHKLLISNKYRTAKLSDAGYTILPCSKGRSPA